MGICGITPRYKEYRETKVNTVTFNRAMVDVTRECAVQYKVEFLPTHLQFMTHDGEFIRPLEWYFNRHVELTLTGGMVLHETLFKEIQLIPMDGNH